MLREYKIDQIGEVVGGGTPSTANAEYWNGDIPWISPKDLTGYSSVYISCGESNITKEGLNKSGARLLPQDTVLFSSRAPIGYVAIAQNPLCTNQGFKSIICNKNIIDPLYLYYYIKANLDYFKLWGSGATFPEISGSAMRRIKVSIIDDIGLQKEMANLLYAYDNLIEVNNKRIKVLEQMAENLYKEWFVRFRFPCHKTAEFENGLPKGWRIDSVKETFNIFDTIRVPLSSIERDAMQKVYPYFGAAELMDYVDDYLFDGIYLLLGEDGSVITPEGKPMLQYVWGKFWVNNHAHILQGKTPFSTEFIHLMFKNTEISGIVTGSAQPKISQGRLFRLKTIIPSSDMVQEFNRIIAPIYDNVRLLTEQNKSLIKQRDLLLPRLMSGKLEV